ncbi:MAG: hypothetical protein HYT09_03685 [Candidatus Levybacteria bacterium]|nr:hypothetical protein [Candidatus Levybacteria bacterium]
MSAEQISLANPIELPTKLSLKNKIQQGIKNTFCPTINTALAARISSTPDATSVSPGFNPKIPGDNRILPRNPNNSYQTTSFFLMTKIKKNSPLKSQISKTKR